MRQSIHQYSTRNRFMLDNLPFRLEKTNTSYGWLRITEENVENSCSNLKKERCNSCILLLKHFSIKSLLKDFLFGLFGVH